MQPAAIPYEIHITISELEAAREEALSRFCAAHHARLLLIELARGECISQPMFSKVIQATSLAEANLAAEHLVTSLHHAGYSTNRVKIEIPADKAFLFDTIDTPATQTYFEWHGRINYERAALLLKLCEAHGVHLSRNALRRENTTRFITLRIYDMQSAFGQRLQLLKAALQQGGWVLHKEQSEYCVYDSNAALDSGWLP